MADSALNSPLTGEQREREVQRLYLQAADLCRAGKKPAQIIQVLTQAGMSLETSSTTVKNVRQWYVAEVNKRGEKTFNQGFIWLGVGFLATMIIWSMPTLDGAWAIAGYFPIIYGAWQLFEGWQQKKFKE